ncbi:MAG: imidazole glycerol phosphate synthase subunit HisF [Candidatus Odinarchaeia archaeon]
MLSKRIIPCLDMREGKVVKGVRFKNLKVAGDPPELAELYNNQGADEIVFLDVTASHEKRDILIDVVKRTADRIFIPFTVGGGIKSIQGIHDILRAGADKVSLNTAAIKNPKLVKEASSTFGNQCIVVAIDAKRVYVKGEETNKEEHVFVETKKGLCWWEAYIHGGRTPTGVDALLWAKKVEELGAGEILLTSMDCDGVKKGYDIQLTRTACDLLNIPVIASGGCGSPEHIYEVFIKGKADAALAASIFHYGTYTVQQVKEFLKEKGISVRL